MTIRRTTLSHTAVALAVVFASGCALEKTDDEVDAFRQALPEARNVRVDGPESNGEGGSRLAAADALGATPTAAEWYVFTREVRDGVNLVTAAVLGSVWRLAHTEPTSVEADRAMWGPYAEALDPVVWRFRIERTAEHAYTYTLEGRSRADAAAAFVPVLTGNGYDRLDERHGDGAFSIDLEAAKRLDPVKHRDDSGSLRVTHDLPRSISREAAPLPRTIRAEAFGELEEWFDVTSLANEDGTGELMVAAHADIDASKLTLAEDVGVESRWTAAGAGRADIVIAGGDLPATVAAVNATECWGADFSRVFYADSVGFAPAEGEESACAISEEAR